jgi:hypothetical protein
MKTCLIRQPGGIGDIIYCQKIGYHYQSLGYKVIWPVVNVYTYIKDYLHNFEYPSVDDDFPYKNLFLDDNIREIIKTDDFIFIPLHGHNLRNMSVMLSKYLLVNLDFNDWKNYIYINRKEEKEDTLFKLFNINEDYRLVNYIFASPPGSIRMKRIPFNDTLREVEVKYIDGFTLFDWMKVLNNAKEICMTDSALALLAELLQSENTKRLICILRRPSPIDVKPMYNLNWKYIIGTRE